MESTPTAIKKFVKNFALIDVVDENEKSMIVGNKTSSQSKVKQDDEEKEDRQG